MERAVFVPVVMNARVMSACLDSGSEVSLCSNTVLASEEVVRPSNSRVVSVQGLPIRVYGEADVKLRIGSGTVCQRFIVADIETDLLLGLDFLSGNSCTLSFGELSLSVNGEVVALHCKRREPAAVSDRVCAYVAHSGCDGHRSRDVAAEGKFTPRRQKSYDRKSVCSKRHANAVHVCSACACDACSLCGVNDFSGKSCDAALSSSVVEGSSESGCSVTLSSSEATSNVASQCCNTLCRNGVARSCVTPCVRELSCCLSRDSKSHDVVHSSELGSVCDGVSRDTERHSSPHLRETPELAPSVTAAPVVTDVTPVSVTAVLQQEKSVDDCVLSNSVTNAVLACDEEHTDRLCCAGLLLNGTLLQDAGSDAIAASELPVMTSDCCVDRDISKREGINSAVVSVAAQEQCSHLHSSAAGAREASRSVETTSGRSSEEFPPDVYARGLDFFVCDASDHLPDGLVMIAETSADDVIAVDKSSSAVTVRACSRAPASENEPRNSVANSANPLNPVNPVVTEINPSSPCAETRTNHAKDLPAERLEANQKLYDESIELLSVDERAQVWNLLTEFHDCFSISPDDLGRTSLVKHRIETGMAAPIKLAPRRVPFAKREFVKAEIEKMLKRGVIRESNSPWAAAVVLVQQHSKWRTCIDYRRLNSVTRKDSFPLPRIDSIFDSLAGSQWFCCLDARSSFWQVEVEPADIEKTAFAVEGALYEFVVMPFGLCNSPATASRLLECIFRGMTTKQVLSFIDDVIVHARSFSRVLANLRETFIRLRSANFKLNIDKCKLFRREVPYLGHVICGNGLKTSPDKVETIVSWPRPTNVTQVRAIVSLAAYYRRFVPGFSSLCKPLYDLTRKRVRFEWREQHEAAFRELKTRLSTAPVLTLPMPDDEYILDCDASKHGISGILGVMRDGREHVVAYFSRILSKTERNYCVTRLELMAVIKAVAHFHVYLYGRKFTLRTDHASLRWLMNFKEPEGQVARWIERLQLYDYVTVHRAGRLHSNADSLSRRPCLDAACKVCLRYEIKDQESEQSGRGQPSETDDSDSSLRKSSRLGGVSPQIDCAGEMGVSVGDVVIGSARGVADEKSGDDKSDSPAVRLVRVEPFDLRSAQENDDALGMIIKAKMDGTGRPGWQQISSKSVAFKEWLAEWDALEIRDGILCRRWVSDLDGRETWLPAVPASVQPEVMRLLHDGPGAAHFGRAKTLNKVKALYYWPRRRQSVIQHCRNCTICAKRKGPQRRLHGPLQTYQVGTVMERVAVDILGPLPLTDRGNRYILVAQDYFSKYPFAVALPNQEATTIAEALVDGFFCHFGACAEIHSDQGRNFESSVMTEVCKLFGVHKTRTTALYPQSDGLVERYNRTLLNALSAYVSDHQRDWDLYVALVCFAYRCAVHESTGVAPCEVMFGRQLRGPVDLVMPRPEAERLQSGIPYVDRLRDRLVVIHERVRSQLKLTGLEQKRRYDRDAEKVGFAPGDTVWLYNPKVKRGRSPKLGKPWTGPYRVMEKLTDVVYRVQQEPRTKPFTVNRFRLHRVSAELPDNWWSSGRRVDAIDPPSSPQMETMTNQPLRSSTLSDVPPTPVREPVTIGLIGEDSNDDDELTTVAVLPGPPEPADDSSAPVAEADSVNLTDLTTRSGRKIRRPSRFRDADAGVSGDRHSKKRGVVWRTRREGASLTPAGRDSLESASDRESAHLRQVRRQCSTAAVSSNDVPWAGMPCSDRTGTDRSRASFHASPPASPGLCVHSPAGGSLSP